MNAPIILRMGGAEYAKLGAKKVFACSVDFPGWCRSGKDEEAALEALADYAPRYAEVARQGHDRKLSTGMKNGDTFTDPEAPNFDWLPMLSALERMSAMMASGDIVGCCDAMSAARPAACGADALVPPTTNHPVEPL